MDDPERVSASAPARGVEGGPVGAPAGGVEGGPVGALAERAEATDVLAAASGLLVEIRRAKSEARRSMRAPVARVSVTAPAAHVGALELARGDLVDAGNIAALHLEAAADAELRVEVQLEPDEAEALPAPPRVTG
jgi:valyl-tRNA synthetase